MKKKLPEIDIKRFLMEISSYHECENIMDCNAKSCMRCTVSQNTERLEALQEIGIFQNEKIPKRKYTPKLNVTRLIDCISCGDDFLNCTDTTCTNCVLNGDDDTDIDQKLDALIERGVITKAHAMQYLLESSSNKHTEVWA